MKKKTYQQPEMQVEKFEQADIICTSTQTIFGIKEGEGYGEEVW